MMKTASRSDNALYKLHVSKVRIISETQPVQMTIDRSKTMYVLEAKFRLLQLLQLMPTNILYFSYCVSVQIVVV